MEYGSKNYYKQSHEIGKLHEKIVNRRKDYLHKLLFVVAQENDTVGVEDLNMQQMAQTFNFGKSVCDNGFGMFRRFLAYKLKAQGKVLVKVSKRFPSSQRCSNCDYKNEAVKNLSVHE